MSTKIVADTEEKFCIVRFDVTGRPENSTRPLIGTVALSAQNGIAPGETVVAAGPAIEFIATYSEADAGLFKVVLTPNSQHQSENDPRWYCSKVSLLEVATSPHPLGELIGMIEHARSKLALALRVKLADVPGKIEEAYESLASAINELDKMLQS